MIPEWAAETDRDGAPHRGVIPGSALRLADGAPSRMTSEFGYFDGMVDARFITPAREIELLADFAYVDAMSYRWLAPKGSIVDGASIPRIFWSLIGSPFTGFYRNASVVHDVACERRSEAWQRVHRMYYQACRCGGVGELAAKVQFAAVYHFGPRWSADGVVLEAVPVPRSNDDVAALAQFVLEKSPSTEEIERFFDRPRSPLPSSSNLSTRPEP